jgi:hypothetical protein
MAVSRPTHGRPWSIIGRVAIYCDLARVPRRGRVGKEEEEKPGLHTILRFTPRCLR